VPRSAPVLYVVVPNATDLPAMGSAPADRMLGPEQTYRLPWRLAIEHKGFDVLLKGYASYAKHQRVT
jgi:hypothetical protein